MRIRTRRIRPQYRKVKPILWVKVGINGIHPKDVVRCVGNVIKQLSLEKLIKDGYIPLLTTVSEQNDVTMEIL
jgi:hypothetical protein